MKKFPIALCKGDGIGPEIMDATVKILDAAGASLEYTEVIMGEKVYKTGNTAGITPEAMDILKKHRIFLKAPITTPQGGGFKSINVTVRKAFKQFANVRPVVSYSPFVENHFPKNFDVTIVRENEEDLYAGIEYRQSPGTYHAIKLLTEAGTRRIVEYAFQYAINNNRKKVTCMTKDNIMKVTDGMFHRIFDEIAEKYPQIEKEHYIIDIGTARLANSPYNFDVVVTLNLYGDIISDVVAEVSGSVGLAGSGNIGKKYSMFEAIHGSAPTMTGQNRANPSGLLNGAIMMLAHIGQGTVAGKIHNALLYTLEQGIVTPDLAKTETAKEGKTILGTSEFADAVIRNLGKNPTTLKAVSYKDFEFDNNGGEDYDEIKDAKTHFVQTKKEILGADCFIEMKGYNTEVGPKIDKIKTDKISFKMMSSRGLTVWPENSGLPYTNDQWRCRFMGNGTASLTSKDILALLAELEKAGIEVIKHETLCSFDGVKGFSMGQAE
jgi:isocitrate dehydrogenase